MAFFHSPSMVVALTNREQMVHLAAFGSASLEGQQPVQTSHLYAIGSIGKVFTAIALLQAWEAGRLDLRAPVTEFLPWFQVKSRFEPITLHHLLTHSSGLPVGTDVSPDPRIEVYAAREIATGFAPGEHFYYSDLGYKILGLVLETVNNLPYEQVIKRGILQPLGMNHTHAVITSSVRKQMASGYRDLYDDRPGHPTRPRVPAAWVETNSGDGSLVSTGEDMAIFARMLLNQGHGPNGPILSSESFQKLVKPMIEDEGEAYSYGLNLFEDDGFRHAGHGGDIPGYESYLWLDLDNGLGTVVLMASPYTPRASFIALEYLRSVALERYPEVPPLPDVNHVGDADLYEGSYSDTDGRIIVFEATSRRLKLVHGKQSIILETQGEDSFYTHHPDWDLFHFHFGRNQGGEIVEVAWGPHWWTCEGYEGPRTFDMPPEWQAYEGHYRSHNPWESNFRVYARKGQLLLGWPNGDEEILVPLDERTFRIGEEGYIPERLVFDWIVEGQALRAVRSGCPYDRFFTP